MSPPPDESCVLIDGPWTHRHVDANGSRFHVVEAGTGPLVLLLHGFAEFWFSWRHLLPALAAAGHRAVAVDLRGYGASDKPPRGYDLPTLADDAAGLVRALGGPDALLVGHGRGGLVAWTAATAHPRLTRGLVVLAAAHPLRLLGRPGGAPSAAQLRAWAPAAAFQVPRVEHLLTRSDAARAGRLLAHRAGPAWRESADFAAYARVCRTAIRIPQASFCALEHHRWTVRSLGRADGRRYAQRMRTPVAAPTLQIHGAADRWLLPSTALGSGAWVAGPYEWCALDGVGHFPQQEAPDAVVAAVLRWAAST